MSARRSHILLVVLITSSFVLLLACSKKSRYQFLSFFFDGVPPPVTEVAQNTTGKTTGDVQPEETEQGESTSAIARAPIQYPHPPYRNGKCGACHNPADGQLFKSVQAGLCTTCHSALTKDRTFLHGPVAVNDCLVCHHYHSSSHPKVLLYGVNETCAQCHDLDDLTKGAYHDTIDKDTCVTCHDPHGSDNRFFLTGQWRAGS